VRFQAKEYDPNATLVIDPFMIFCSFSGSTADNWGFTATYGPDASLFGGGIVFAQGFPTSVGAFQTTFVGGPGGGNMAPFDIGIIKLTPNGGNRVYATYVGGFGEDQPHSLVCDPQGNLVIAGRTNASNYPVTGLTYGPRGGYDIIITKLNASGTGLIGSTVIGGSGVDGVNITQQRNGPNSLHQNYGDDGRSEVILDNGNNIYVVSSTQSTDLTSVTGPSFQPNFGGGLQDGLVIKLAPDAQTLQFASYLGGSGNDAGYVLALGPNGNIYVSGGTESADFPGSHAGTVQPALAGVIDGYIAEIANDGSAIIKSTFIGTNGIDQIYGIQFDRNGFPYVMGQTTGNWTALNAPWSIPNGKIFIAKLASDLSAYVYKTMFGSGTSIPNISPTAFLVDRCENVYVSGWGGAQDLGYTNLAGTQGLPLTPDALDATTDNADFYFFVLEKNAASQLYGTYFGQTGGLADHVDGGTSRFDPEGIIYQALCANCGGGNGATNVPTTPGSWSPTNPASNGCNLQMVKIAFNFAGVGSDVESQING